MSKIDSVGDMAYIIYNSIIEEVYDIYRENPELNYTTSLKDIESALESAKTMAIVEIERHLDRIGHNDKEKKEEPKEDSGLGEI